MSTPSEADTPQEPERVELEPPEQADSADAVVTEPGEAVAKEPAGAVAAESGAEEPTAAGSKPAAKARAKAADAGPAAKAPARAAKAKGAVVRDTADKGTPGKDTTSEAAPAAARSRVVVTDLPQDIFDARVNVPLIHQVVVAQQAAARQGTHATKTRGDVRGGGKKPYRQKGTGRARQGSIRAPQFTGGGVAGGPVSRSHAQKTPKKMKAAALRGALSDRARHGLVHVVDGFLDDGEPKTKDALSVLTVATGAAAKTAFVLVVAERSDQLTWKSLRNAPGVHLVDPGQLNTYDVLVSDRVVFTSTALASFVARAGTEGGGAGTEGGGARQPARQEDGQR